MYKYINKIILPSNSEKCIFLNHELNCQFIEITDKVRLCRWGSTKDILTKESYCNFLKDFSIQIFSLLTPGLSTCRLPSKTQVLKLNV